MTATTTTRTRRPGEARIALDAMRAQVLSAKKYATKTTRPFQLLGTDGARVVQRSPRPGMRYLWFERKGEEKKASFAAEFQQLRTSRSRVSDDDDASPKFVGAALWETLSMDEVRCVLAQLQARDLGALGVAHRAFALPTSDHCEERLRYWSHLLVARQSEREPWWRTVRASEEQSYNQPDVVSAGGSQHELFADSAGNLFSRGRGTCGQLGLGADVVEAATPTMVVDLSNKKVVHVAAGAYTSLVVTDAGDLYAFGKASSNNNNQNVENQNPNAPARDFSRPRPVLFPRSTHVLGQSLRIVRCSAGTHHCLAADATGAVWSWGKNTHGQLGLGSVRQGLTPPRLIRTLTSKRCFFVSAGAFHSLVVDTRGDLYAFGLGADGRLGLGHSLNASLPERVLLPADVEIAQCDAGVAHSACVSSKGHLYAWGDPTRGALGHRDLEASRVPRKVDLLKNRVLKAKCSLVRTLALDDDGAIWSIANAQVRRLALPKKYASAVVRDVACASEDTVLVALRQNSVRGSCYLDLSDAASTHSGGAGSLPGGGGGGKHHSGLKVKAHYAPPASS